MKNFSIDNGLTKGNEPEFLTSRLAKTDWDVVVNAMDNNIREVVHNRNVKYSNLSFLCAYLRLSKEDLIIG
jgi:hypothetical protein